MSSLIKVREMIDDLNHSELNKVVDYCNQIKNDAIKKEFIQRFSNSEFKFYANLGKGTSDDWKLCRMIGIENEGVLAKDWSDEKSKRRTVKWDNVLTPEEKQRKDGASV